MQILSFVKAQVFVCLFTLQRLPLLYVASEGIAAET